MSLTAHTCTLACQQSDVVKLFCCSQLVRAESDSERCLSADAALTYPESNRTSLMLQSIPGRGSADSERIGFPSAAPWH